MSAQTFLYLSRKDIEQLDISMLEIIQALEKMFVEKGSGRTEMPPKPGIHPQKDAFIHAMPAFIQSMGAVGMKWVSGFPENQRRGLPYISGLLILNDPETGIPISVMDATWITAKRTGAATALAAKYLARKNCSTVGIIACGVQGRSNLEALAALFRVRKVRAFDIHPEVSREFADEMGNKLGLNIEPVARPQEAVVGLDIVVTSGPILKDPQPVVEAGWLAEGVFASPVDFDCYWKAEALKQADKLATDDMAQMEYYRRDGYFRSTPTPYADLGEIIAGKKPGRQTDRERTISINLGLALEDMASAILIYKKALARGLGRQLPF